METNNPIQDPVVPNQTSQQPPQEELFKQKDYFLPILIAIIVLFVVSAGGYLLYQKQAKPTAPQPIAQLTPSPTPDETVNWRSYINTKANYNLRYPNGYILHEERALYPPEDLLSYISLELCNIPNASDCGMGSDALNINVYNNTQTLTLDNWVEQSENSPKANKNTLCTAKDPRNQIKKVKFLGKIEKAPLVYNLARIRLESRLKSLMIKRVNFRSVGSELCKV